MKNLKFSRLFAAALLVACFAFAGCKPQVEEVTKLVAVRPIEADDGIIGTWVESSTYGKSYYRISTTAFENDGEDSTGTPYDSYAGDNIYVAETSETSCFIFIKYTKAIMPDWSYSTSAPDVGKWYALSFKNLDTLSTPNKVSISGAYTEGGKTSCATLKEAIAEFTEANGYFDSYSACAKQ